MSLCWKNPSRIVATLVVIVVIFSLTPPGVAEEGADGPNPGLLDPELAQEQAPESYRVRLTTTKGEVVIEVSREWAPHGADRFYNLVKIGFYDDTAFYRVIAGFMAQVGAHGDPAVARAWTAHRLPDDPVAQPNTRGMVTFAAGSAPNTRTTQIFINYGDNSYLTQYGKFAPIGKVVEGMEIVDQLFSGYGEGAPRGRGPDQARIAREGNAYLKTSFPKLDYIIHATLESK
jgi:peptidyl-prolyl cis-trans isomerase A (cyclophilin A)